MIFSIPIHFLGKDNLMWFWLLKKMLVFLLFLLILFLASVFPFLQALKWSLGYFCGKDQEGEAQALSNKSWRTWRQRWHSHISRIPTSMFYFKCFWTFIVNLRFYQNYEWKNWVTYGWKRAFLISHWWLLCNTTFVEARSKGTVIILILWKGLLRKSGHCNIKVITG